MLKRILISIGILAAVCLGGFITYIIAYGTGEAAGYDKGYSSGQDAGYSSGKQDGYDLGKEEGYNAGYTSGKADGYDEGMQAGFGHGYTLRDPTYAEAVAFIREDKTNENEYIEGSYGVYVCSHFSRDVCNNAEGEGLRCAYVALVYPEMGHAIVAFNTVDQGLVYFDAITDERARPVIGERYYKCIEPRPGYYYVSPSFDDTIMDILVIW
jgi:hypothetical protein